MKIIYNSFVGGIFRTLGRFVAIALIGLLVGYIVSSNGLKIADLLGIGTVKAWGNLDYKEARGGINQRICNSNHTNCTASSSVTLSSLNTYLSYLPCTDFTCPNNERHSDYVGVFRVSLSFNDNHSFDNDCYYRLWFTIQLQGLNTNQVVLNNLEEINSSIYLINHSYNTTTNATGMFGDGSIPQIYFERISASGYVRLTIIFHPNDSGYHYVDTTFGLKNPNMSLTWNNMPPFKGFNSIRYSTGNVQYSRQTSDIEQVNSQIDKQNWVDVNNNIGQVENSVNEVNDNITDSNVDESKSSFLSFFTNFTYNNHGLSGIITAPLSAIQSLTSSTCSPLVIPLPFVNSNLTLPCMREIYVNNFGTFMTIYDIVTLGIVSYWVLVRIFGLVKGFQTPNNDEIEVVDL